MSVAEQLRRVGRRWRRVPYVAQTANAECGMACLAMCLRYHGRYVRADELRQLVGVDRDGADAATLLEAAEALGLRARGVSLDLHQLEVLEPGSLLHWEFNHFVVFDRLNRNSVDIVDPASGPRRLSLENFGRSFTGVAVILQPGPDLKGDRSPGPGIGRYLTKVIGHRGVLSRIVVTSLLLQFLALYMPILMGVVVDRVVPGKNVDLLRLLALGFVAVVAFNLLASLVRSHLFVYLRNHLDADLSLEFQERMFKLPYSFFQSRSSGDLIMRLNSNSTVRDILTSSALSAIMDGSLVSLYLILLLIGSPGMLALVLLLGTIRVGVFLLTRRRQKELMTEELQKQATAQGYQYQMLSGIEVLKAGGAEDAVMSRWRGLYFDMLRTNLNRGRLNASVESVMGMMTVASPLAILLFGAHQVLNDRLSLGAMLALSALAAGFLGPLSTLVSTALDLQVVRSYIERIEDVLDARPEQDESALRPANALKGSVTLERVHYRYGPRSASVLKDVSLEVRPGQFVAIVGRSGAGKSTLAHLLVGLYRPTSGRLLYDGVDQNALEVRSVRRQLGVVPQQTFLFGETIRDIITMSFPDATKDDIVRAARAAAIHDDIEALPLRYETVLGDNGESLAGGQRQRLALARALVGRPRLLLLDEATSDLDTLTEKQVYGNLAALNRTRIVIAHRLSSIREADLIVALDRGRIVETGTHAELLRGGGIYAELVAVQAATAQPLSS